MAARATISVYATLGVATATVAVVGAILVGPAILDCSRDAGAFGACLRGKAADSGLISPKASSEQPTPAGWMEAVANEYEPPLSLPVELEGTPADLLAEAVASSRGAVEVAVAPAADLAALAPAQEEPAVSVALGAGLPGEISAHAAMVDARPGGTADLSSPTAGTLAAVTPSQAPAAVAIALEPIEPADGLAGVVDPPPRQPAVSVALVGPEGGLSAGVVLADPGPAGSADLGEPADGTLAAVAPSEAAVAVAVTVEPADPADSLTSAVEPPPSEPVPVELSPDPVPSAPEPLLPEPSSAPAPLQPEPSSAPEPPSSSEPALVVEYNPQFPNVIVLPPPTIGEDSSFRSLRLN